MPLTIRASSTRTLLRASCAVLLFSLCAVAAGILSAPRHADAAVALVRPPNNLGLASYWSFNEGSGTVATDFSGNGNTAILIHDGGGVPAWATGKRGKALERTAGYVEVDGIVDDVETGDFTVGFWFKPTENVNSGTGEIHMFEIADASSNNDIVLAFNGGGALADVAGAINAGIGRSGGYDVLSSVATSWTAGVWHHAVLTYSTVSGSVLYVDGVSNDTDPATTRGSTLATAATLFKNAVPDIHFFNGSMDEVRIYNRALAATEVAKLYQSGAVKFNASSAALDDGSSLESGLVGHWTFDGADTQATIADRSGQNNHGYFNGGATSSAKVIGKLGQALRFDGVDDTVETASGPTFTTSGTIAFWMRAGFQPVTKLVSWGPWRWCQRDPAGDEIEILCTADAGNDSLVSTAPVFDENWHHVVFALQNASGASVDGVLYVDGVQEHSSSIGFDDDPGNLVTIANRNTFPSGDFYNGLVDDVRIYNRALTADEVKQLYNLGTTKVVQ